MDFNLLNAINGWCMIIGQFFVSQIVYSTILFVIVLIIVRITRNRFKVLALGLWSLIFLRLILPTDLSMPFSGRMLAQKIICFPQSKVRIIHDINNFNFQTENSSSPQLQNSDLKPTLPFWIILIMIWLSVFMFVLNIYMRRLKKFKMIIKHAELCGDDQILQIVKRPPPF